MISIRYDRTDEQDGDMWVAKSHLLGFVFCAPSKAALDDSVSKGIEFFVESLIKARGRAALRAWLDDRGIEHFMSDKDQADIHDFPDPQEVAELAFAAAD